MSSYSGWYGGEHDKAATKRGKKIHRYMAGVMAGRLPVRFLSDEIRGYDDLYETLKWYRFVYNENGGGVEQKLAVNNRWGAYNWPDGEPFYKCGIDLWFKNHKEQELITLVDWKTGQKDIEKHSEQLRLYTAILYAHQLDAMYMSSKIIYLDLGEVHEVDNYIRYEELDNVRHIWENRKWATKHFDL